MSDLSSYKVGVVVSIEDCGTSKGKSLRACQVNIGDEEGKLLTVVTAASNVREGSRLAVAPVGSTFIDESGQEITVQKTAVGGVMSEGIFCDSRMLGWTGGAAGVAAQIPASIEIGAAPPATKPRPPSSSSSSQETGTAESSDSRVEGLFEKKLTKEEKKKLAEERRKARKQAKDSKQQQGGTEES